MKAALSIVADSSILAMPSLGPFWWLIESTTLTLACLTSFASLGTVFVIMLTGIEHSGNTESA